MPPALERCVSGLNPYRRERHRKTRSYASQSGQGTYIRSVEIVGPVAPISKLEYTTVVFDIDRMGLVVVDGRHPSADVGPCYEEVEFGDHRRNAVRGGRPRRHFSKCFNDARFVV